MVVCVFTAPVFIDLMCLSLLAVLAPRVLHSFPTRRSSDLVRDLDLGQHGAGVRVQRAYVAGHPAVERLAGEPVDRELRSEEHTSELQSLTNLVCRLLLEKKKTELTPPRNTTPMSRSHARTT